MPDYPLDPTPFTLERVGDTGNCKIEICNDKRTQENWLATYADGPRIRICICPDSFMNVTGMAYRQGQVPLAVRSSVATITAGSKGKGGGAWCMFNDIAYFGDFVPNVFLHESGHALDFAQGNMYGSMGLSGTDAWHSAIDESACCPDPYAKSNEVEDWAQNTVARYWAKSLKKTFNDDETSCMTPQLQYAFSALPERYQFDSSKAFYITSARGSVLTTRNGAQDDNSQLSVENNNRGKNQIWKIMPTAYDWYIACEVNSFKCLDNQRDSNVGKNAIITYRTAFISMQHRFVDNGDGTHKIINRISGLALSSGCPGRKPDGAVYVKDDGNDCQKWKIIATDNSAPQKLCPNGIDHIVSRGPSGGQITASGKAITSPDCNLRLVVQGDGNLVLYDRNNGVKWASGSFGGADNNGDNTLIMQPDGNLVLYNKKSRPIWSTGTYRRGQAPYTLSVQNNATISIVDGTGSILWKN